MLFFSFFYFSFYSFKNQYKKKFIQITRISKETKEEMSGGKYFIQTCIGKEICTLLAKALPYLLMWGKDWVHKELAIDIGNELQHP